MTLRAGAFNVHTLLAIFAGLALAAGAARSQLVGSAIGGEKTRLSFWNGFTGPDGIVMLDIIEDFNRANPDIEVTMQRIPWATYYNKLTVAGADQRGPQVFVVHSDALARIRRAGFIADIRDIFDRGDVPAGDFRPSVLKEVSFGEARLGVPLDIHPQGMFVNREMLSAAGLKGPNGEPRAPRDKEEFLQAMSAMTQEAGGELPEKQWGFALTFWGNNLRSLIPQFGGRYLDEEGRAVLDSEENIAALEFLASLAKESRVPPPDNGLGWFGFRTARVGMVWEGIYMLGDLIRVQDVDYIGAPIPQIGPKPGTLANSHLLCVREGLSEKERRAAEAFIAFLSQESLRWAAAGQVPARTSVQQSAEFKGLQVQSAFAEQLDTMMYQPRTPIIFELGLELDRAAERAIRGLAEPREALQEAHRNIEAVLERDRREHPEEQQ